jgi:hypothetical protein
MPIPLDRPKKKNTDRIEKRTPAFINTNKLEDFRKGVLQE